MNKIVTAFITIGTLVGMLYAVDALYLHRTDFEVFAAGYAADKGEAKVDALTQRQWKVEDRIESLRDDGSRRNAPAIRTLEEQKKELQEQIDREKEKLKSIYEKQ
jgi:peptidoglycan hydrolase CwlO-like protein